MRMRIILGLIVGVALASALFGVFGTNSIGRAFAALGWIGFAAIVVFHLGLIVLMGIAWWLLVGGRTDARPLWFVHGRLMRDSASQAIALSQLGGMVLGTRVLTELGTPAAVATASLIVDIAIETTGLVCYALIGFGLLWSLRPASGLIAPIGATLAAMAAVAVALVVVQVRGSHAIGRWLGRVTAKLTGTRTQPVFALPEAMRQIHARYRNLALAWLLHIVCWLLTAVQMWLTLRLMDLPVRFGGAVVIDSLSFAMRSLAFFVPSGIGVQEGAFVLLGGLFGLAPQAALGLSLVRRARDLAIAVPVLIGWQLYEGRQIWRQSGAAASPAGQPDRLPPPPKRDLV